LWSARRALVVAAGVGILACEAGGSGHPNSTGAGGVSGGTLGGGSGGSGAAATGGTSAAGRDGVSGCGNIAPCGGSPVGGTWSITNVCYDLGEYNLVMQHELHCPELRVTAVDVATPDSAFTFSGDGTYSEHQHLTAEIAFYMPVSCTGGVTCGDWAREQSVVGGDSYACDGTTTCVCVEIVEDTAADNGMYRVSGSNITLNSGVSGATVTVGYCIEGSGSTIHLMTIAPTDIDPAAEPTILRDIIARRSDPVEHAF
jgi:hypothetical protein